MGESEIIRYRGQNGLEYSFDTERPRPFSIESFRALVKSGELEIVKATEPEPTRNRARPVKAKTDTTEEG